MEGFCKFKAEVRNCERCGAEFIARTFNKRFCTKKCQQQTANERRRTTLPSGYRRHNRNKRIDDPPRKLMAAILLRAALDLTELGCIDAYEWLHCDAPLYADVMGFEIDVRKWAQEQLAKRNYQNSKKIMVSRNDHTVRITVS